MALRELGKFIRRNWRWVAAGGVLANASCGGSPVPSPSPSEEAAAVQTYVAGFPRSEPHSTAVQATLQAIRTNAAPMTSTPATDPHESFEAFIETVNYEPRNFASSDRVLAGSEFAAPFGVTFVNHSDLNIGINEKSWLKLGQLVAQFPQSISLDFHKRQSSIDYDANSNTYEIQFHNNFELVLQVLTAVFAEHTRHGEMEVGFVKAQEEALYWTSVLTRRPYAEYVNEVFGRGISQPASLLEYLGDPEFMYASDMDFMNSECVPIAVRLEGDESILPLAYRSDGEVPVVITQTPESRP